MITFSLSSKSFKLLLMPQLYMILVGSIIYFIRSHFHVKGQFQVILFLWKAVPLLGPWHFFYIFSTKLNLLNDLNNMFCNIPWEANKKADKLAKVGTQEECYKLQVCWFHSPFSKVYLLYTIWPPILFMGFCTCILQLILKYNKHFKENPYLEQIE